MLTDITQCLLNQYQIPKLQLVVRLFSDFSRRINPVFYLKVDDRNPDFVLNLLFVESS